MDWKYLLAIGIFGLAFVIWFLKTLHQMWCSATYRLWLRTEEKARADYIVALEAYSKSKDRVEKAEARLRVRFHKRSLAEEAKLRFHFQRRSLTEEQYDAKLKVLEQDLGAQLDTEVKALEQGLKDLWNDEVKPAEQLALSLSLDRDWIWKHRLI